MHTTLENVCGVSVLAALITFATPHIVEEITVEKYTILVFIQLLRTRSDFQL